MTTASSSSPSTAAWSASSAMGWPGPVTECGDLWNACGGSSRSAAPVLCAIPRTTLGSHGASRTASVPATGPATKAAAEPDWDNGVEPDCDKGVEPGCDEDSGPDR